MRRAASILVALSSIITSIVIISEECAGNDVIEDATEIGPGTEFSFSYDLNSPDGSVESSGSMTATVSQVEWRGFDCYLFSGAYTETFTTTVGSGSESGTWTEYYRTLDLALMDSSREGEMIIGSDTVQNSTLTSYNPPLRWIEFPLSHSNPKSIWPDTPSDVSITSTWERTINNDDETLTSGADSETLELMWVCMSKETKITGAGNFDTFRIRENVFDDQPRNQTSEYFYSEEVGFWVEKNVFVDHEGSQVRVKHYELTDWNTNGQVIIVEEPSVEMYEDTTDRSIDLDDVFSDPDNDPLEFNIIETGPITVDLEVDNSLTIVPPPNYFGSYNITVSASDGIHEPLELEIPVTVWPVDDPPSLMNPDLSPHSGDTDSIFIFSIELTDIDSASPSSAELIIGTDSMDLSVVSGDNVTGMTLQWSGSLPAGNHMHHFEVDGSRYPATGEIAGPTVTVPPQPYIETGGVDIDEGGIGTSFLFTMTWIDPDGQEPDEASLLLDGTPISLERGSGDPRTGKTFEIMTNIPEGDHSFHFEARLNGNDYRYPLTGEMEGPFVHHPEITESGFIFLGDDGSEAEYRFFVSIRYPAGMGPETTEVLIDGISKDLIDMEGNLNTGVNYSREIDLEEGLHKFHFKVYIDGVNLETVEKDLLVVIGTDDDTNDEPIGPEVQDEVDNSNLLLIIVVILIVLAIAGGAFFFLTRNKTSHAEKLAMEDEKWDEYS